MAQGWLWDNSEPARVGMGWADMAVCLCYEGEQTGREKEAGEGEPERVFQ